MLLTESCMASQFVQHQEAVVQHQEPQDLLSPFERAALTLSEQRGSTPENDSAHVLAGAHTLDVRSLEKSSLGAKLSFLVAALGSQFQPGSLGLVQVRNPFVLLSEGCWHVCTDPCQSQQAARPSLQPTFCCSPRQLSLAPARLAERPAPAPVLVTASTSKIWQSTLLHPAPSTSPLT